MQPLIYFNFSFFDLVGCFQNSFDRIHPRNLGCVSSLRSNSLQAHDRVMMKIHFFGGRVVITRIRWSASASEVNLRVNVPVACLYSNFKRLCSIREANCTQVWFVLSHYLCSENKLNTLGQTLSLHEFSWESNAQFVNDCTREFFSCDCFKHDF